MQVKKKVKKLMETRIIIGSSFLIFGFLVMGLGVILFVGAYIALKLFLGIIFLSLDIMIVGALIHGFFDALRLVIGFSVAFVVIILMISRLLPVLLTIFSDHFIVTIIFGIIYWTILIACSVQLAKISLKETDSPTAPLN